MKSPFLGMSGILLFCFVFQRPPPAEEQYLAGAKPGRAQPRSIVRGAREGAGGRNDILKNGASSYGHLVDQCAFN